MFFVPHWCCFLKPLCHISSYSWVKPHPATTYNNARSAHRPYRSASTYNFAGKALAAYLQPGWLTDVLREVKVRMVSEWVGLESKLLKSRFSPLTQRWSPFGCPIGTTPCLEMVLRSLHTSQMLPLPQLLLVAVLDSPDHILKVMQLIICFSVSWNESIFLLVQAQ